MWKLWSKVHSLHYIELKPIYFYAIKHMHTQENTHVPVFSSLVTEVGKN